LLVIKGINVPAIAYKMGFALTMEAASYFWPFLAKNRYSGQRVKTPKKWQLIYYVFSYSFIMLPFA
jgi:hypothetical protein